MISVTFFDSIRHWHDQGMSRREIARRLNVDVKTVRRQLRKMAAGATAAAALVAGLQTRPLPALVPFRLPLTAPRVPRNWCQPRAPPTYDHALFARDGTREYSSRPDTILS